MTSSIFVDMFTSSWLINCCCFTRCFGRGLAGVGAEAMLATSTRLLAALLNHADSAEWFRTFGDEEVEKTTVKEEMDAQMPGCW